MFKVVVWGQKGSLDLLVSDKSFPEGRQYWPSHGLKDRTAWNEEVGKIVFQFKAAQLDVRQSGFISMDVCCIKCY